MGFFVSRAYSAVEPTQILSSTVCFVAMLLGWVGVAIDSTDVVLEIISFDLLAIEIPTASTS